jgi:hypothetical protein
VQIGATAMLADPFPFSDQKLFMATIKGQPLRAGRWRWALLGGLTVAAGDTYGGYAVVPLVHAGSALSYCLSADCHSMASVSGIAGGAPSAPFDLTAGYAASLSVRLTSHVKLVGEALAGARLGEDHASGKPPVVTGGLRLFGRHFAADLAVATLFDGHPQPLPFFSLTARL